MNKEKPTRNNSSKNAKKQEPSPAKSRTEQSDEINLMKPNFAKKKPKATPDIDKLEEETNEVYERLWSEEEDSRK